MPSVPTSAVTRLVWQKPLTIVSRNVPVSVGGSGLLLSRVEKQKEKTVGGQTCVCVCVCLFVCVFVCMCVCVKLSLPLLSLSQTHANTHTHPVCLSLTHRHTHPLSVSLSVSHRHTHGHTATIATHYANVTKQPTSCAEYLENNPPGRLIDGNPPKKGVTDKDSQLPSSSPHPGIITAIVLGVLCLGGVMGAASLLYWRFKSRSQNYHPAPRNDGDADGRGDGADVRGDDGHNDEVRV